ncbi:unnamed protein product, partial [Rotaria magnacalcarata]
EGTTTHGGAVLAIDRHLKPISLDCQQQPNIIAAAILVNNKLYTIISTYSPPTEKLPLPILSNGLQNSQTNIILGDFNAKNITWGCTQTNQKGRELESRLKLNTLNIHNPAMITSLRSKATIDLIISTDQEASVQCNQLSDNGSDHFPILTEFNNIVLKHQHQYIFKKLIGIYTPPCFLFYLQKSNTLNMSQTCNPTNGFKCFKTSLAHYEFDQQHRTLQKSVDLRLQKPSE